ncbi:MAG: cupin domain-containing protein [Alphaproteobacteria bacterium]
MSKIQVLRSNALSEAPSSPSINRHLAFKDERNLVLRSRTTPGAISGWHHHGDYDVYGYLVSGSVRFESGPQGKDAVSLGRGDFFHVPPHTVHREVNPSADEGQEVILFLCGTGPAVVNVNGPDQT